MSEKQHKRPSHRGKVALLLTPALVLIGVIILYPLISGIVLSFKSDPVLNQQDGFFYPGGFVGFRNYGYWLTQSCPTGHGSVGCPPGTLANNFWPAFGNTLFFTLVTVLLETILGIGMALVMAKDFHGRGLLRAAVLVPWAIPTAITAKLWAFLFSEQGIVIPKDLYEAARMDGANAWQRFTRITLPLAKNSIIVAVLFRMLDALRMYDLPYIMVGPNPDSPTATLSQLVVAAIRQDHVNAASALSTLIFLLIFLIALCFVKSLGSKVAHQAEPVVAEEE